eukprot:263260-Amphidinium_carterae.1
MPVIIMTPFGMDAATLTGTERAINEPPSQVTCARYRDMKLLRLCHESKCDTLHAYQFGASALKLARVRRLNQVAKTTLVDQLSQNMPGGWEAQKDETHPTSTYVST